MISQQSATLRDLGLLFDQVLCQNSRRTIVQTWDQFRIKLGRENADLGPKGSNPTDIYSLTRSTLAIDEPILLEHYICRACEYQSVTTKSEKVVWTCPVDFWKNHPTKLGIHKGKSVMQWYNALAIQKTTSACPQCDRSMQKIQKYEKAPNIIAFITTDKVVIENQITLPEIHQMYRLCGIVYYHNQHFVCRFVDQSGGIWYHDGITTKDQVQYLLNSAR